MELILNTFGVSLTRENDGFIVISNGEKQRVPTDGIRSIHISKGAQITSDAVMLAIENEIDILFVDRAGNPFGRVWSPRYGSISTIRKGQINFLHGTDAVEWIKDIIEKKIANQQSLLFALQPEDGSLSNLVSDVQSYYDNHDSILICPVSTDLIKNMKIIGKNINISLITRSLNALFF